MQKRGLTLQKLLHGKIFDDVFNRQQTQLVRWNDFFEALNSAEFESSNLEKGGAIELLRHSSMPDVIVLSELELILSSCGLRHNLPQTKNFDYTRLDARSKRILNRLHAHLEKHSLSPEEFLAPVIENVIVEASNKKSEELAIFNSGRFHALLHEQGIRRSDEEYDNLNLFLCLNENTH